MAVATAVRLSRRERELSLRKEIILEAAEEIFSTKGYYEAAVEEIASRAEISVGTLYNLFTSKEALYLTLFEQRVNGFFHHVAQCAEKGQTAAEKLDCVLAGIFAYLEQHQAFSRLYVTTTHGLPWHLNSDMGEVLFARYKEMQNCVTAVCQQGKDEGVFHTESPFSLALAILGVANAFLTNWIMGKKKRPLSDSLADVQAHVRNLTGRAQKQ